MLRAEVFGPYPPGSGNDPIWYFEGDSLRFWSVKVEVDTTRSSAIFGVPTDTTEAVRDSVRTVFRVLPDSASSRVSFVHSPAGQGASFWHCVTNAAGDTVRAMRELDLGSLATVGVAGEDRWRYIKEWSPQDDGSEWLDPADGPFESHMVMGWEEEGMRDGIWRWVWDRHRCRGMRLRLIVYGGNGASEIDRQFYRVTGSGVYVPLNDDHDNGTIQDDREALMHGGFLDSSLVRVKLLLETEGGEWNGQGTLPAKIRLACTGGRLRIWRGNVGGTANLLATPDETEEYVWDLAEDAAGVPRFIGTRAEFLAERGNLWIEGYRGSGQVKDAAIRVGIQSGTY